MKLTASAGIAENSNPWLSVNPVWLVLGVFQQALLVLLTKPVYFLASIRGLGVVRTGDIIRDGDTYAETPADL